MFLDVAPNLLDMDLSATALVARNVDNARTVPELIAYRRAVGRRLAAYWKNRSISAHPVIREYHRVHSQFGAIEEPPAPEKLVTYVRRNRDFTASGAVVDCYNIVSARTLLSIGAHDLEKLTLPITLRTITPQDIFIPLGQTEPQPLSGEYAYVDSQGSIICRLDVLQCEPTKTTKESSNIVFFLQGNRCLPATVLLKGAWLLAEMVSSFCGAAAEIVSFIDANPVVPTVSMKPYISFETFKHLNLMKGTILQAAPLPTVSALSTVTVQANGEIEVLALSSTLSDQVVGQGVIVATNLHPLVIGGETFTSHLLTLHNEDRAAPLQIDSVIPDGARLY
jgi:DNA/RNA-binding domain of Phe-tRNA-synthetase-like protein